MVKIRETDPLLPDGGVDVPAWLERVAGERSIEQVMLIQKALDLALSFGTDIVTPFGDSCFHQGIGMGEILHHLGADTPTLAAAIVYDDVRYGRMPIENITHHLGEEVANLVLGVQKLQSVHARSIPKSENLRRMLLAVVEDVRVVLIKLAEHICEMRAAVNAEETLRHAMAEETLHIYAPLANRLGIGQLKWELEDLAFRFLEPAAYKRTAKLLDQKRIDRESYINDVIQQIQTALEAQNIEANITGRAKHIYSICKKMQRKGVGYNEIYDVRAIRILVSTIRECYATLGTVHSIWQPIPKEFDDYIANPKANGYRSLHTAVLGPMGKTLEVQIRTVDMHHQAELGVSAHWRYKEGGAHDLDYEEKLASLRQILKWQHECGEETDAEDTLRREVFKDRVYILTPKGKVIDLPKGATALDFAYHVHTELGNRCRGVKVNGKIMPLTYVLKSGEQLEILPAKAGGPSRDWINPQLGYIKTARARAKAHQWFKRQDREQNILDGREVLEREFKRLGIQHLSFNALAHQLNLPKADDLFSALGGGEIRLAVVLNAIQILEPSLLKRSPTYPAPKRKKDLKQSSVDVRVMGVGNLLCQIAKCCSPISGDEIIGYITVGRGVSIHKKDCSHILQANEKNQKRYIQVEWGHDTEHQYMVNMTIHAYDRQGLLRDITDILAKEHISVISVMMLTNKEDHLADFKFTIQVSGIEMLGKIFPKIQQLPNVIEVHRVAHH